MAGIVDRLTEGIVNRDMRAEGGALLNKWEKTGLLEGLGQERSRHAMARLLDNESVPEENRWFVAPPIFYEKMFQAGGKIAEVQVTGDDVSPLRNGLVMNGTLAGFRCYKTTALNSTGGVDQVTLTDASATLATDGSENVVLAGHMSATSTASHIAKTEVVRSTESFSDVIRGLHVFGSKVLRQEAVVRGVIDFA